MNSTNPGNQKEKLLSLQNQALESAANGIVITDPNGSILWSNRAFTNITGFSKEEVIGQNPRFLKSEKQPPQFYKQLWDTITSGKVWKGELTNTKKDGSHYIDEMTITPVKDNAGKIINFIAIKQDITARKKAENEAEDWLKQIIIQNNKLQESEKNMQILLQNERKYQEELIKEKENVERIVEERTKELKDKTNALKSANDKVSIGWHAIQKEKATLAASIRSLPLGFILTDKENNLITVNDTAKKLLKFNDEMINLVDIEKIFVINFNLLQMIDSLKTNLKLIDIKEATLGNRNIHISLVPIVSSDTGMNEFIGTVILIGDITERKLLERSRDEFFSIASHELRTPLTAIRGNVQLLKEFYQSKVNDREFDEMVSDIHESSIRLIEIVNDFLNTSRLEMKEIEFNKEIFSLTDLIREVEKEIYVQADNKGLFLKFDTPVDVNLVVKADKNKTKEILINLIGNSLKFTKKGGITVSCQRKDNFIETVVTDTGIGISRKNQFLLFKKFQQAEDNIYTRDVTQGTGLGLYISRLMVNGMGGEISLLNSTPLKGSSFSFTLPIANL